jgi:transcriptional regulator with XRE-family HTH domain
VSGPATALRSRPVGELLRSRCEHRRLSQLELSLQAAVPTRHLNFVETGRAAPGRELVLELSEQLDVPLRERNRLLLAAVERDEAAIATWRREETRGLEPLTPTLPGLGSAQRLNCGDADLLARIRPTVTPRRSP